MKGAAIILDRQQLFDVGKRHAVVATMADEAQALQIVLIVDPVVCRRAFCVGQQTDLFIVADGDCRAAGNFCDLSYPHVHLPDVQGTTSYEKCLTL